MRRRFPACLATLALLACGGSEDRPSFIVINLDDARPEAVAAMPSVDRLWRENGIRFVHSFVPTAQCCPSRASLLTGLYARHHGVQATGRIFTAASIFRKSGSDRRTVAVWLQAAGYRTGLFGKYLNGYTDESEGNAGPDRTFYIPPGWTRWWAFVSVPHYGGPHGQPYEIIEENRTRTAHTGYSTDLSAEALRAFVTEAAAESVPFLAVWTPYASHAETPGIFPAPAERHFGRSDDLPPWRPPSWNESDVTDKPRWVQELPEIPDAAVITDRIRRRAHETLMAVDEQIELILRHIESLGLAEQTVVLVTSDNGVGWGEHRLFMQWKGCPYQECQRVPMIVASRGWEGVHGVVSERVVLNIDIAPTLAALAGVEVPDPVDGESLRESLVDPRSPARGRKDYVIEFWKMPEHRFPVGYVGVSDVARGLKWIEYETGERELYDLRRDPWELTNLSQDPAYRSQRESLEGRLQELLAR